MKLGKRKDIDLRKMWKYEASDFTKWLSEEENLFQLSEVLKLNLSLIEREQSIGDFKCDLFCKDESTNQTVVIENQLELSNHDHLGKIITYASGLKASIIVWIVKKARNEHISAISWLNENTDENISFFLLELHLYTIDESLPALEFKTIEQPKEFSKKIKGMNSLNKTELNWKQLAFWEKFNQALAQYSSIFKLRKTSAQNWYDLALGSSKCFLRINLANTDNRIDVNFFTTDKNFYDKLEQNKEEINKNIPYELSWDKLENKKSSKIYTSINELNLFDDSTYDNLIKKIIKILIAFNNAFKEYI